MYPRINLVTLGVSNLQRSIDFYEKGLGWKRSEESNDNVAFFKLEFSYLVCSVKKHWLKT